MSVQHGFFCAGLLATVASALGVFSQWPTYRPLPPNKAVVVVSFSHVGTRAEPCRELNERELSDLPANMRRPKICPRRRIPVLVEVKANGEFLLRQTLPPSGFAGDGPAQIYEKFLIPSGEHIFEVAIRDSKRSKGFDFVSNKTIRLEDREVLVVDLRPDRGIWFRH